MGQPEMSLSRGKLQLLPFSFISTIFLNKGYFREVIMHKIIIQILLFPNSTYICIVLLETQIFLKKKVLKNDTSSFPRKTVADV